MTKIKLCGLQSLQDVAAINALMPDYAGFIFASSKRQVTHALAHAMRAKLHPDIQAVGVFVNPDVQEVVALCKAGTIDMVQLHGDETAQDYETIRAEVDVPVICVVPVGDAVPAPRFQSAFQLYDTLSPARGGTGVAFDRALLRGRDVSTAFLAGGLTPENVADAICDVHPYAVDVSSGVETDGRKDPEKMKRFVEAVRRSENRNEEI